MLKKAPKAITSCYLECVVMPNGEVISIGKTVGWVKELGKFLTPGSDTFGQIKRMLDGIDETDLTKTEKRIKRLLMEVDR